MSPTPPVPTDTTTVDALNRLSQGHLPSLLGIEITSAQAGRVDATLAVHRGLLGPGGHLHGAAVVALADTACGYGCRLSVPEGVAGFTTIELKSNFLGTVTEGRVDCSARIVHSGRTTQVWDAEVTDPATNKTLALFRCTMAVIWPRAGTGGTGGATTG